MYLQVQNLKYLDSDTFFQIFASAHHFNGFDLIDM